MNILGGITPNTSVEKFSNGIIQNFICLPILVPTHLPIKNGGMVMSRKIFLILLILIADNGAVLQKKRVLRASSSQPNIMTDFVYGRVSIPNTLFVKANGRMARVMC